MSQRIKSHFLEAQQVLATFLAEPDNLSAIERAAETLVEAFKNGNKVISCGNGGSMCDAMHFAEELSGKFREDRKPFPAIAISDAGYLSCVGNDYGYDQGFARFVEGFGSKGDVLLAISTSGNSKNVLLAAEVAQKKGMHVIALTGKGGGKLASLAHTEIRAPYTSFADRAQEIHIKVIHALIDAVEEALT